jgi:hypothetical protein
MDVKERQLATVEQEIVLRGLAEAAARPGCRFLEVGSWCGHSSAILGLVARQRGGLLFCVDWWRGNDGTPLADLAAQQDIFALFWQRILREGLEDVVVPIRGRSESVAEVLRPASFDLIFLDGDHRYEGMRRDVASFSPLVRPEGGILCGHDCEGRLSDFDADFLEAHKDADCHEAVHCGVVRAVGEAFADYSLNHSIWSVRARGANCWAATDLLFSAIRDQRQSPPGLIARLPAHNLLRYGKRVYAVPHWFGPFDVMNEQQRNHPMVVSAHSRREVEALIAR